MIPRDKITIRKSHVLEYVQNGAWAILPEVLDTICSIVYSHLTGNQIDIASVEAALGRELKNEFDVIEHNGTAIIPVMGVIARRMNLMSRISGGVSTELVQKSVQAALDSPDIKQIVLRIDSPGGAVDGTKELVDFIYSARGRKPIIAVVDGEAASAAYWIASAADEVMAYDTSLVGSIGVVSTHYDYSKQLEREGITKTYIYAGKYKRIANDAEPLSKEGRAYLQDMVDTYYSIFVESVARNRGVSVDTVLSKMADGKLFIGEDALKAGLIDGIGTISDVLSRTSNKTSGSNANEDARSFDNKEEKIMTLQELREKNPELVHAIEDEARKGFVSMQELQMAKEEKEKLAVEVQKLDTINKDLVKSLALLEEKASSDLAAKIKEEVLAESNVPEKLHSKVMEMLDHNRFIKDGERFEENSASANAFREAFKAEVKDWEGRLGKTSSVGVGEAKNDSAKDDVSNDIEYGRQLARKHLGAIRSDAK